MVELKQKINELVEKFISATILIDEISLKDFNKDEFYSLKQSLSRELGRLSNYLRKFQNLEWDTLNVAFFGETNAGKSTLIEALIRGDGRSIGTGIKDFTKEIKHYSFGEKIKLLDMPGIEGDEKRVKNEIWKAVNKAHIVFYIFSHSKEPEKNTLLKIRQYLNKNAYVYGLINIRGIFSGEVLENLLKKNINIVEERSRKHLKEYLGDSFKDIFIVHTLYAFFSRAKHIPDNLKDSYKSALKHYSSIEKLEKVSNIKKIEEIIQRENQKKPIIISWDHTKKILKSQESVISNIISLKKNFDKALKDVTEELNILQESLKKEQNLLKDNIKRLIENETAKLESNMLEFLYEAIENTYDKQRIEKHIESLNKQFSENLKQEIEKEIQSYSQKAKERADLTAKKIEYLMKTLNKFFHKKVEKEIFVETPKIIDIENILKELKWTTKEIVKEIGDAILSIILKVIYAFRGGRTWNIITLVIVIIRKFWEWFFYKPRRKKAYAKKRAQDEVKKITKKIKKEISYKVNTEIKKIESEFRNLVEEFKKFKAKNKEISIFLQKIIDDLKFINYKTSEAFLKYLDSNVRYGYIQTSLKEGTKIIIVSNYSEAILSKLESAEINKENIFIFNTIQEAQNYLNYKRYESEFFKRSWDIFIKIFGKF